jgi:putative endonuclease
MDLTQATRKEIGALGERLASDYLETRGLSLVAQNVARKTGELDLIMRREDTLHFVEVKTITCIELPDDGNRDDEYDPSVNLHEAKVRKVARTAEWFVAERDWEGEWQVDACLVWLRLYDGASIIEYLPQIV